MNTKSRTFLAAAGTIQSATAEIFARRPNRRTTAPRSRISKNKLRAELGVKHCLLRRQLARWRCRSRQGAGAGWATWSRRRFPYVATTSAVIWEGLPRRFRRHRSRNTLCLEPRAGRGRVDAGDHAILATHVNGNACDVEGFEELLRNAAAYA
jgi:hypothetical protein